jgi:hypothetical protein
VAPAARAAACPAACFPSLTRRPTPPAPARCTRASAR